MKTLLPTLILALLTLSSAEAAPAAPCNESLAAKKIVEAAREDLAYGGVALKDVFAKGKAAPGGYEVLATFRVERTPNAEVRIGSEILNGAFIGVYSVSSDCASITPKQVEIGAAF